MRSVQDHKYFGRTSEEVRSTLLALTLDFVRAARTVAGVTRIAALGSLLQAKPFPKDADVLVTIRDDADFGRLAQIGRRLKGRAQAINSGADIFLADESGKYLGRVCHYRECFPRRACQARTCGSVPHLNDDLDVIALAPAIVLQPPLVLHPVIEVNAAVAQDVQEHLIDPLRAECDARRSG